MKYTKYDLPERKIITNIDSDIIKATPHNLHLQTKPPSKMLSG